MTDWNLIDTMTLEWNEHLDAMQRQFEIIRIYDQPPKLHTRIELIDSARKIHELLNKAIEETCGHT